MTNNSGRGPAESARDEAERLRQLAEEAREARDRNRDALESARQERERLREAGEIVRIDGEQARAAAEVARGTLVGEVQATADTLKTTLEHMRTLEDMRRITREVKRTGKADES